MKPAARSRKTATDASPLWQRMERIWATVGEIPRGRVLSYGEVAQLAGMPRGARQVGYALRHLPGDRDVPWHRVITASGKLAFAPSSRAWRRQAKRLLEEDVPLLRGRVDLKKYRWQPDLDELLWKPSPAWDRESASEPKDGG